MIALAVCWFVLFRASAVAGQLLLRFTGAAAGGDSDRWFDSFWVGLLSLASVALGVAVLAPSYYALPLLLFALYPSVPAAPRLLWPIAVAMTYVASSPVRFYDSALYHHPAIEWMSAAGLVPGLGMIHFRFGFTSSWLALTSLFNVGPLHQRADVVVTGLAISVSIARWIQLYRRDRAPETYFYLAALPMVLTFYLSISAIVSPSPDLGAALAVLACIALLLREPRHEAALLIAAGASAIKLAVLPLPLVCLAVARRHPRLVCCAAAMMVVFSLATFQTTGCAVFPLRYSCIETPHSIYRWLVSYTSRETIMWARYAGTFPSNASLWSLDWLPQYMSLPRNAITAALSIASLAVLAMRRQLSTAVAAAVLGSGYIYLTAPDPRFGAGFLLSLPALALPPLPWPRLSQRLLTGAAVAFLVAGTTAGEWVSNRTLPDARYEFTWTRLVLPAPAWTPSDGFEWFHHNGVAFTRPVGTDRCGAAPLPCTPYELAPTLRQCGRGWCR